MATYWNVGRVEETFEMFEFELHEIIDGGAGRTYAATNHAYSVTRVGVISRCRRLASVFQTIAPVHAKLAKCLITHVAHFLAIRYFL